MQVNLSSGTPQMTVTLSMLLATGFLRGEAVKVTAPSFAQGKRQDLPGDYSSQIVDENACLTESDSSVFARLTILPWSEHPVVEHITRSNAVKLCQRYDYSGAQELLRMSPLRKQYDCQGVLGLIGIAEHLFLLRLDNAKKELQPRLKRLRQVSASGTECIQNALECHPVCLLYMNAKLRKETGGLDEFIRAAGLLANYA